MRNSSLAHSHRDFYRRYPTVGELVRRSLQRHSAIIVSFNRIRAAGGSLADCRCDGGAVQPHRAGVPVKATCPGPLSTTAVNEAP
jgi:hypothetical protein